MTERDKLKKRVEERLSFYGGEETPEVTSLNQISSPLKNMGDNVDAEKIKMESAGQIGAVSDEVWMGSPAMEYGNTGRYALSGMIKESQRLAREKYQATHDGE